MCKSCPSLASIIAIAVAVLATDTAVAQLPWRGHYKRRDGLFHVEKMHWGGGITANGASVLNTGITAFAPIVGNFVGGRELEDWDTNRDLDLAHTRSMQWQTEYTEQLRRANDLLQRTERLAYDYGVPDSIPVDPPSNGGSDIGGEIGPDPWNIRNRSLESGTMSRGYGSGVSGYRSSSDSSDMNVERDPWRIRRN